MKNLQAEFILELMNTGLSFEESLEKSFDKVNTLLNEMNNSEFFKESVFNNVKNIIKNG